MLAEESQYLPLGIILGEPKTFVDEPNIPQASLFLPLHEIGTSHKGMKIRTIGQIIAYDIKSSILLLAAPPQQGSNNSAKSPVSTILVDLTVPLLHMPSPAIKDIPLYINDLSSIPLGSTQDDVLPATVNRQRLRIERGGWVTIVGWLEGEVQNKSRKSVSSSHYAPPLPLILEAITIHNSRAPSDAAIYRGSLGNLPALPNPLIADR